MSIFSKLFKKHPKNYSELKSLIEETIGRKGPFCDLNFIDVSKITNMSHLFEESVFDGDISRWDVSNVVTMYRMFRKSKFTGDISQWNVSNVVNMNDMFDGSDFKGDISGWSLNAQLCKPFTDLRDGEVYRTCRIGNQVWMAENLRYCCKNGGCFAPNGQSENIPKYGLLYSYAAAEEACPPGWHLPSKKEWEELMDYLKQEYPWPTAPKALLALEWSKYQPNDELDCDRMDPFGFAALPAGYKSYVRKELYCDEGYSAVFWSSTYKDPDPRYKVMYYIEMNEVTDAEWSYIPRCYDDGKCSAFSVRCIMDEPTISQSEERKSQTENSKPFSQRKSWMEEVQTSSTSSDTSNSSADTEIRQLEQKLIDEGAHMNALQIRDIKNKIESLRSKKCHELAENGENE